jgi:hypothetical protein
MQQDEAASAPNMPPAVRGFWTRLLGARLASRCGRLTRFSAWLDMLRVLLPVATPGSREIFDGIDHSSASCWPIDRPKCPNVRASISRPSAITSALECCRRRRALRAGGGSMARSKREPSVSSAVPASSASVLMKSGPFWRSPAPTVSGRVPRRVRSPRTTSRRCGRRLPISRQWKAC